MNAEVLPLSEEQEKFLQTLVVQPPPLPLPQPQPQEP
jgi:hypothetical protein